MSEQILDGRKETVIRCHCGATMYWDMDKGAEVDTLNLKRCDCIAPEPVPEVLYDVWDVSASPYRMEHHNISLQEALNDKAMASPFAQRYRHNFHPVPSHIVPTEEAFRVNSGELNATVTGELNKCLEYSYPFAFLPLNFKGGATTENASALCLHQASCMLQDALREYPDAYIEHVSESGEVTVLPRAVDKGELQDG